MCDNCPSTACSPATPKAAQRKHPGNPKVRVWPADAQHLRLRAKAQGVTTAEATRDIVDLALASEGLRRTAEDHRQEAARQRASALAMAEERNKLAASLARLDALAAALVCEVADYGGDTMVTIPEYPEIVGRDKSPTVARLEAAVEAANYLPRVAANMARARGEALRGEDAQLDRANAAEAKLADERQAHAATAAALGKSNERVEKLTVSLATAEANAADSARCIDAQRKMLEVRDARLESQTWTIGGLGIGLAIALLGMALVVA